MNLLATDRDKKIIYYCLCKVLSPNCNLCVYFIEKPTVKWIMTVSHMHVYGSILTRQMYTRCLPVQIIRWFNIKLEKSDYLVSEHRSDGTMK